MASSRRARRRPGVEIRPGKPLPFGATVNADGVHFAVFSRHAHTMELLLFAGPHDVEPSEVIDLVAARHRTGDVWHVQVDGIGPGQCYLYRARGPYAPAGGHRFNPHKALLDPYAQALAGDTTWHLEQALGYDPTSPDLDLSLSATSNISVIPKCVVVADDFDWQGDRPLNNPLRLSVIYETHVRGLTLHPSSADLGVAHPGTFRGVIEMIPYLKELGITALELLPVQEFDELENRRVDPVSGKTLQNYWGYSTVSFFAPKGRYSSAGALGEQVNAFKEMVRELHRADIEVILDIVFNHTAEGGERGPTLSFRGLDNRIYYILADDPRYYADYTGCGNTLNCNHPLVRSLILDCLRAWVVEMHVDGFRFDLGSVLGRDQRGGLMENPPILERIAQDPILRHTKVIAEAWDAAGAYQVGWFPGGRWAEWNDRFRDDVRAFWRGDPGCTGRLATRLTGSSDLYLRDGRKPFHSINFITAHDGFTLNDLVSYERKHNDSNGEGGRDGSDNNLSRNYGVEGPTDDPQIEAVRTRQVKNLLATLLLSLGTPMLLGGDEIRRSQLGNNNAYCHNDEVSWYDWTLRRRHAGVLRFCRELIAFRRRHPAFLRPEFFVGGDTDHNRIPDIEWFAADGGPMDWEHAPPQLAYRLEGSRAEIAADRDDNDFYLMFNASEEPRTFVVCPAPPSRHWCLAIDTGLPSPQDIRPPGGEEPLATPDRYRLLGRSVAVLLTA